jgi:hypothetical protein
MVSFLISQLIPDHLKDFFIALGAVNCGTGAGGFVQLFYDEKRMMGI